MLPTSLTAEQFRDYPTEASKLAVEFLRTLQKLPLAFLPSLLRELIDYDFKFPLEQVTIQRELTILTNLVPTQLAEWFQTFSGLHLSPALEQSDWVHQPGQFVEQLSAYLWSTHQLDAFRSAATEYGDRLRTRIPPDTLTMRRLGIAVIGQGVNATDVKLFRKLREHGTYFSKVDPDRGLEFLLIAAAKRAEAYPLPYAHWYVDGGLPAEHSSSLTCVAYQSLTPARDALLKNIQGEISRPGMGPEELRTHLARLAPADLGMSGDPVLNRFQVKLLTEGSGTQIYSTTFAQWTGREVLRRAQALTLLVRFAPRQRERPMNELFLNSAPNAEVDPAGSLIDADMAAYYQWLNQQRLPGSENSSFLAWFEGHHEAVAIGPSLPRGAESASIVNLEALLGVAVG